MKRLIVIPTYNEAENAPILIRRIFKYITDSEILIIDDASPDGTARIIEQLQKEFPQLHLLKRGQKTGLGSAYRLGFAWGLEQRFAELIEMDADLSHRVRDLSLMIQAKELNPNVSLVIGSRWINGGKTQNWSKSREILSRSANLYVRLVLGMGIRDATAGFRIYSAEILRKINLNGITSEGYSFQIEMTREVHRLGGRIIEVPITFREREQGISKMSKKIILEAMLLVSKWGFQRLLKALIGAKGISKG
jgi:dolichol-phosphate mannosyltransferase